LDERVFSIPENPSGGFFPTDTLAGSGHVFLKPWWETMSRRHRMNEGNIPPAGRLLSKKEI